MSEIESKIESLMIYCKDPDGEANILSLRKQFVNDGWTIAMEPVKKHYDSHYRTWDNRMVPRSTGWEMRIMREKIQ